MQYTCLICKVQVTLIWPYVIIFLISKDSLGWHYRPNNMPKLVNFLPPFGGSRSALYANHNLFELRGLHK